MDKTRVFLISCSVIILMVAHQGLSRAQTAGQDQVTAIPKWTLADCIVLGLKNNLDVRSAYLNRITQRFGLKVAEYQFQPQSYLQFSSNRSSVNSGINTPRTTGSIHSAAWYVTLEVPTGGTFSFSWPNLATKSDVPEYYQYNPAWALTFSQPLLKGAGIEVATGQLRIAKIQEEQNILGLKNTLTSFITSVISAYRSYLQSVWQLEIAQVSLEAKRKSFEADKALVSAGRKASSELVEDEASIADYEIGILQTNNAIDQNRLILIQLLNIGTDTMFEPAREPLTQPDAPHYDDAIAFALKNRPDYLSALRDVENAKVNLLMADNNRLWDLQLRAGVGSEASNSRFGDAYSRTWSAGKSDWNVGAVLTIPLRDLTIEQTYVNSKVALEQAKLALKKLETGIAIAVKNGVRDAQIKKKLVEQAKRAQDLAQQKYDNELIKLKLGRTTNFQALTYQDDLVQAQLSVANAVIDYSNALTTLDQTLGTTLDTWRVQVKREDDEVRFREAQR
jgi:outer membrane protein TolC